MIFALRRGILRTISRFPTKLNVFSLHTSNRLKGLEEFFEGGKALPISDGQNKVVYGRAWSATELRLKSFEDLHKLWFLLLKELNLLFTQRSEATRLGQKFFAKSRIHKCRLSMARIKTVLTERCKLFNASKKVYTEKTENRYVACGSILVDQLRKDKLQRLSAKRKFRQRVRYRRFGRRMILV